MGLSSEVGGLPAMGLHVRHSPRISEREMKVKSEDIWSVSRSLKWVVTESGAGQRGGAAVQKPSLLLRSAWP